MKRISAPEVVLKDRVRFALASYNAGPGHLDDARVLAKEEGLDPNRWFGHTEKAFMLLSKPRYYQKAKHGFARSEETVKYVSEIQTRYDAYVALTDGAQTAAIK
jgi:membrane-bound lytic murein transglycosylase F